MPVVQHSYNTKWYCRFELWKKNNVPKVYFRISYKTIPKTTRHIIRAIPRELSASFALRRLSICRWRCSLKLIMCNLNVCLNDNIMDRLTGGVLRAQPYTSFPRHKKITGNNWKWLGLPLWLEDFCTTPASACIPVLYYKLYTDDISMTLFFTYF